jgi:enoyl-CoA hydratase/carnithine racemase
LGGGGYPFITYSARFGEALDMPEVLFTVEDSIAWMCLNRPERLNAYTPSMRDLMRTYLNVVAEDDGIRVLVITGAGQAFCSGSDIRKPNQTRDRPIFEYSLAMREGVHPVFRKLHRLDKPVIAMIDGPAVSGGLALALLCDFRIASDRARLGDRSTRFGYLPDEGGAWLYPRFMGVDRAFRMVLCQEIYDAPTAHQFGLVSEVVPAFELEPYTRDLATRLSQSSPVALRLAKTLMRHGLETTFEESLNDASLAVMVANPSSDAREGVQAFREGRDPQFPGT